MTLARPWFIATAAATASAILALAPASHADARQAPSPAATPVATPASAPAGVAASRACPPAGIAVSFSDRLDKLVYHGVELGGLSSLAWDQLRGHDRRGRPRLAAVSMISDDNFSATQFTRVLNLLVKLP
jgi:hypothetical protein